MKKAKMLAGVLAVAMAMVGCAGAATSTDPAQLDVGTVSASIDGRTDLFIDAAQSRHLLTADEVNGSPTAVAVEVQLTETQLIAWRAQPSVPAAERSRTEADIVARFDVVGTVDLSTAEAIGNETHPTQPGQTVNLPGGVFGHVRGGTEHNGPSISHIPLPSGLRINWGTVNGIPNAIDVSTLHGATAAHPGCA